MIRQGQESVLVVHLLNVIQPLGGYAVVQQLAVRHSGEHGALGGDVAWHLYLAHHLADLDELRRAGVRMLFKTPAFRPAIRIVVHSRRLAAVLCTIMRTPLLTRTDQKFLSLARSTRWNCSPGLRRIELKNERIRLRGPLLLAVQPGEALDRVSAMRRSTADPLPSGERSCQIARAITPSRPDGHTTVTEYYLGTIQLPQIDPFSHGSVRVDRWNWQERSDR